MREEQGSDRLDRLWEAYRQATPEPEVSAGFMPQLWTKIEAAQKSNWVGSLEWLAARLLPLAAAIAMIIGVYVWMPGTNGGRAVALHSGYVEMLAADLLDEQKPALWMANGEDSI